MQGTWKTTGGGDSGFLALAVIVAVVLLSGGGAAAIAAVVAAVTGLLIAVAVITALILVAAVVVLVLWLHGRPAREARAREFYASRVRAFEQSKQAAALERHQRALELARASAPVIQNIMPDPAPLFAAFLDRQLQPPQWPADAGWSAQAAPVYRGEVER
jgi:hypothetical protein